MKRSELIKELKKYFSIHELVDKPTYQRDTEKAWRYLNSDLLETLLFIRVGINRPITINNYFWGGKFSQRGLRSNLTPIFKSKTIKGKLYLSGHTMGAAIDFDVEGMTAEEVRGWLLAMQDEIPCKIRLEHKRSDGTVINWVHLDVFNEDKNPNVYLFNI